MHLGTESEHQVLNSNYIFVSFTRILLLFCTKFQYSSERRQDEEGEQSDKTAIRHLVLTQCTASNKGKLKPACIGGVRSVEMGSVEGTECRKCKLWKMWSFENGECKRYVVWSVENVKCGKCGVLKMGSAKNM